MHRSLAAPVLTAPLAVLLAALACAPPGSPEARATPRPTSSATAIEAFIPIAERFVEQHRGLKFKRPPKVTFLEDAPFNQRLRDVSQVSATDLQTESEELKALRLIGPAVDLGKAEDELNAGSVVGFYDPKTKELYVRGVDASPSTRSVLVHELTHALQDQYYNLDTPARPPGADSDEADYAFHAVVEGDAVRVQAAYIRSLPPSQQRQALSGAGSIPADVPRVLLELQLFLYQDGYPFVLSVLQSGGQSRLEDAFKASPRYTTEIIHPDRWLAGFTPAAVSDPPVDGTEFDHGILGEFGILLLLERLPASALGSSPAGAAAAAWRGDRYAAWRAGGQACLRDHVATDTPAGAAQLAALLGAYPATTVTHSGSELTFTTCGPLGSA